jgi:hypothetical protein
MEEIRIAPLVLQYGYFGVGPGQGGIAELRIELVDSRLRVQQCGDVTNEEEFETIASIDAHEGWRAVLTVLTQKEVYAFYSDGDTSGEYPWPGDMRIEGPDNYATDLIACGWAGPPVSEIALALSAVPDESLTALREQIGTLRDKRFLRRMIKTSETVDELDLPLGLIVRRAVRNRFDPAAMLSDARALAKVMKAEDMAARARHEWSIAPFKEDIARVMESWRNANPSETAAEALGTRAWVAALQSYLEEYAKANFAMPSGRHTVRSTAFGQSFSFEVDFDSPG